MVSRAAAHNLCRKGRQQVFFWKREGYGGGIQLLSFTTEGVIMYRQDGSRLPSEVRKQGVRGSGPRLLQGKRFSQCTWLSNKTSPTEAMELLSLEIFRRGAQSPKQPKLTLELAPLEYRV